jgi:hypothetical protein
MWQRHGNKNRLSHVDLTTRDEEPRQFGALTKHGRFQRATVEQPKNGAVTARAVDGAEWRVIMRLIICPIIAGRSRRRSFPPDLSITSS